MGAGCWKLTANKVQKEISSEEHLPRGSAGWSDTVRRVDICESIRYASSDAGVSANRALFRVYSYKPV